MFDDYNYEGPFYSEDHLDDVPDVDLGFGPVVEGYGLRPPDNAILLLPTHELLCPRHRDRDHQADGAALANAAIREHQAAAAAGSVRTTVVALGLDECLAANRVLDFLMLVAPDAQPPEHGLAADLLRAHVRANHHVEQDPAAASAPVRQLVADHGWSKLFKALVDVVPDMVHGSSTDEVLCMDELITDADISAGVVDVLTGECSCPR